MKLIIQSLLLHTDSKGISQVYEDEKEQANHTNAQTQIIATKRRSSLLFFKNLIKKWVVL